MSDSFSVMLVEDEAIVAMEIEERLKILGYEVIASVASGEEAIEIASKLRPEVILMDIRLKGSIDGIQAANLISRECGIPVIFITAYSDDDTLKQARASSPYGYLVKPFKERDLHATIQIAKQRFENDQILIGREEQFRLFFENAPIYCYLVSLDGNILDVSDNAIHAMGYNKEEIIGKPLTMIFAHESMLIAESYFSNQENIGSQEETEAILATADGSRRTVMMCSNLVETPDGRQSYWIILLRDITERKVAEKALYESEKKYRTLVESMQDLVFVYDENECYSQYYAAIDHLLYSPPGVFMGKHISDVLPKEVGEELIDRIRKVRKSGESERYDYPLEVKGTNYWFSTIISLHEDGKSIVSVVRDITQRKQAEEALQRSEQSYRRLITSLPEGIGITDLEENFVFVNNTLAKLLGYKVEELLNVNLLNIINPEDIEKVRSGTVARKAGMASTYELEMIRKDGKQRIMRISAIPHTDEDGMIIGGLGVFTDISEQKHAEEALRTSEERFRLVFKNAGIGISYGSDVGSNWAANPALCKILGYTEDELISLKVADFSQPEDQVQDDLLYQEMIEGKRNGYQMMKRYFRKDGQTINGRLNVSAALDSQGNIQFAIKMIEDITEQIKTEEALRESEKKYRNLLNNIPQKVFYKNQESIYITCNPAFSEDIGIKPENIDGKTDFDIYPKNIAEQYRKRDLEVIESGQALEIDESFIKDGEERFGHTVKVPVFNENNECVGILGIFWDITERKESEMKIEKERDRAKFFVDVMGHDLSNINQAINMTLDLLLYDESLSEHTSKLVIDSLQQVDRSARLISDVKKFVHFSDNPPEIIPLDLNEVLLSSADAVQESFPQKSLKLTTNLESKQIQIMANEYLQDVFYALFHNAMNYSPNEVVKVEVKVDIDKKKEQAKIQVSDWGRGIPDTLKRNLFKRVSLGRRGYLGSGIGLTLLQNIIDTLGGRVWVEDRVKDDYTQGANFVLILPTSQSTKI